MPQLIRRASNLLPIALVLLAMLSVQAGASIAKTLFPIAGPIGMVAIRIAFGTIILVVFLRPWRVRVQGQWPALLVYGISLGVMNLFYYLALSKIPLGVAVAIEFVGPLAVAVFASHRAIDFFWILLAACGLILLLPLGHVSAGIDPVGAIEALAAGGCWALYIIYGKRAGADHGPQTVAIGSVISAILIVPVGLVHSGAALFSQSILVPGIAVAILSTALPYTLEMGALTRLPARTFGVLMSVEPAFGALFGYVWLKEMLTTTQWLAIALIIAASAGTTLSSGQASTPASAPVPH